MDGNDPFITTQHQVNSVPVPIKLMVAVCQGQKKYQQNFVSRLFVLYWSSFERLPTLRRHCNEQRHIASKRNVV